jgi:uncharacterized protein YjiK
MFKQIPFFIKKPPFRVIAILVGLIVVSISCACKKPPAKPAELIPAEQNNTGKEFQLPYDLEEPATTFKMVEELREISGLSIDDEEKYLWAVQDEKGIIYKISLENGKVVGKEKFWKDGDYEGIERVGNDFYVLKNTGTIYKVSNIGEETQSVEKFNTPLGQGNDVEGLGYDSKNNRLLLACKGNCSINPVEIHLQKAIYAFNLDSMGLDTNPVFMITFKDVRDYLNTSPAIKNLEKLTEYFQPGETEFTFGPSAVSIHPQTGDIYVLSSTKKIMVVLSSKGEILHIEKMKKSIHPQAEGLCFAKDGTLFIANEGKDGKAKIHRFSMK